MNPKYSLEGLMLKLTLQYFVHLMTRPNSLENILILGKIEGKRRRGGVEGEMVKQHYRFRGHEFDHTPGDSRGQRSLAYCHPCT